MFLVQLFSDLNEMNWVEPLHRKLLRQDISSIVPSRNIRDGLINNIQGKIYCFPLQEGREELKRKFEIQPDDILANLNKGCTIYLLDFLPIESETVKTLKTLADKYLFTAPRVSLFLSRNGSAMPMHWDNTINITIQLEGEKNWQIAKNKEVTHPSENYAAYQGIYPPTGKSYAPDPADIHTICLKEGEMLFLPRGYWHATETSDQESTSLSLNMRPFTVADYVWNYFNQRVNRSDFFQREIRSLSTQELSLTNQALISSCNRLVELEG